MIAFETQRDAAEKDSGEAAPSARSRQTFAISLRCGQDCASQLRAHSLLRWRVLIWSGLFLVATLAASILLRDISALEALVVDPLTDQIA